MKRMQFDLNQQKQHLRQQAKQNRQQGLLHCPNAGLLICQQLLRMDLFNQPTNVAAFWPLAGEIDTLPTMHALHALGHQLLLPIMQGAAKPLLFGHWHPNDTLVTAAFGTQEPAPSAQQALPNIILAPLLAFDRRGFRLGYGGGFYDRTIAKLTPPIVQPPHAHLQPQPQLFTIGLALSVQEIGHVPTDTYDLALDKIVTEKEVIHCT